MCFKNLCGGTTVTKLICFCSIWGIDDIFELVPFGYLLTLFGTG